VYEADLRVRELRKHGLRLKLQDKPFEILAVLLEHPGELVTREDLRQRLWSADTFVDFEHSLSIAVHKLRQVLGDSAENPRFIETLPRRGYRFIAPVQQPELRRAAGKAMLAVLPFENLNSDPEQEYFSDGLTEEMITQLGRLNPQRLGVIARTSVMRYKRSEKPVAQIGPELGVDYVLEGSVRRAGKRVRVTAQLIQVSDQTHLWAETLERNLKDILALQREVAERIARSLAVELLPGDSPLAVRSSTGNSEAYELYLRGRYHWNKRTEEGFAKAIDYFGRAIELDKAFAPAYAGLADAYNIFGLYGALPPQQAYGRAKEAAHKALEIDSRLAEAYCSRAFATLQYDWDWKSAEKSYQRALELNPNYATAHHWHGLGLMETAQFERAQSAMERALRLDPLSVVINSHLGWLFYFSRQFDQAIAQLQRTLDLEPEYPLALYFLGMAYEQRGVLEPAIDSLRKATERSGRHPGGLSALVHALASAGKRGEALRVLEELHSLASQRHVSPYFVAFAHAGLGNRQEAINWLEKACAERSGWMLHLAIEPAFDSLRGQPDFQALMLRTNPMA
jgi:TolB-like protein/Tfp pilus assembly protein PilF